ncbi:neuronal acetylcholine receptor subunit alpha-3 [Plakobranchus ocellatus]|uniref:Neuronal acetylcholine receptor subunit alpha-3 n=1 Tax=Plakobranchus ocellatus TaxID=259542 RepID=A0AAV4DNK5_9GAST|nr:neuronal acetylcholine receptor subunit alpha-3 [Plakobranchus ocellatus]
MYTFHLFPYGYVYKLPTLLALLVISACNGGTYSQRKSIYDTLLTSSNYNPTMRPLLNQSDILYVNNIFELVSIVEVNDVVESFECNGFLGLRWFDQILTWNASDYGGEASISPDVKDVFRPRMVMLNTLGDRDLFEDDNAPLMVLSNGLITWTPGGIFPASCKLDLTKYPFDVQTCAIHMIVMNYMVEELQFVSDESNVSMSFFTENGQWEIIGHRLTTPTKYVRGQNMSSILISFQLKRKPVFLVISIILPIVFLSLLNLLVFLIPVDSGEKISYGITVLLALTVFLSTMSGMLPRSSESMPLIITYIFILMVISVLTVVASIIIVRLHHLEEVCEII